ncbi:MAG: sugar-binding transcriptional regulator [Litoreibacter sp.]|nr:sugar-binding transcriptional regulator [Litoreibacter sp.]
MRAAWLHYGGGLSQTDVAKRLSIPKVKAHRLIARASQEGAVKVSFDGEIAECVSLEMSISEKFGLTYCEVAPDLDESDLPTRALSIVGAAFLTRELGNPRNKIIGVGNGRTLSACIRAMSSLTLKDIKFVSLMGGLTRNFAANPHDVMHRLAERTGAEVYFMPVPFYANSSEDRDILLAQRGVPEVMGMAHSADLKVVGIGAVAPDTQMVQAGVIGADVVKDINAAGGVGELIGHFFNVDGEVIKTAVSDSVLSVDLEGLRIGRAIAIAGGEDKVNAIRAILKNGLLDGLITDEYTAKMLLRP